MDTVKTTAFCNLPKDALVKLISSDYLGLEEEDVWRAVLNWAKYQVHLFYPLNLSDIKSTYFLLINDTFRQELHNPRSTGPRRSA